MGWISLKAAPTLAWEDIQIREATPDGPRYFTPPSVTGIVKEKQRTCTYNLDSYYDFLYRPTGLSMYHIYPKCSGNPEAVTPDDPCDIPKSWPR